MFRSLRKRLKIIYQLFLLIIYKCNNPTSEDIDLIMKFSSGKIFVTRLFI
jgi:hypothetical protein